MSDESINCYGFRVLTNGIDTETAFAKNPVSFWNHRTDDRYKDSHDFPVAKWLNWKKQDGKLIGDLQVDDSNDFGKELVSKIENGYINAVSIYFDPIEVSDAPEHLLAGQTRSTITRCVLLECSLVGLPGNFNAVKLKQKEGGFVSLNATSTATDIDVVIPRIKTSNSNSHSMTKEQKELIGLDANATDEQVTNALNALKLKADKVEVKPADIVPTVLAGGDKTELETLRKERVTTLINQAINDKKFTEADRGTYTELANSNFDSTKKAIENMQATVKISQLLNSGAHSTTATTTATKIEDCEFYKLSKGNPTALGKLQQEDEAKFNQIKDEYLNLLKTN